MMKIIEKLCRYYLRKHGQPRKKRDKITDIEIIERLDKAMRQDGMYLKDITIEELAQHICSNRTYVSETLNARGMTFKTYVNNYRTRHAMRLIRGDKAHQLSAEEIACASGFRSERSLNDNLKRIVGCTFSVYRKKLSGFRSPGGV